MDNEKTVYLQKLSEIKEREADRRRQLPVVTYHDAAAIDEIEEAGASEEFKEIEKIEEITFSQTYEAANAGDPEAMYTLYKMYSTGNGTRMDTERAMFWQKEAARKGSPVVKSGYALTLLNMRNRTVEEFREGMKYLEQAADGKYEEARREYIDRVTAGFNNVHAIKKAIHYCRLISDSRTDKYEKENCHEVEKYLRDMLWRARESRFRNGFLTFLEYGGSICLIFGAAYMFCGAHPDTKADNIVLRWLPEAPSCLVISIEGFWKLSQRFLDINGRLGIELLTLSSAFCTACMAKSQLLFQTFKGLLYRLSKAVAVFFLGWHFYERLAADISIFKGSFTLGMMGLICFGFGKLIGKGVRWLTGMEE